MDRDRVVGAMKSVVGGLRVGVGRVSGERKTVLSGRVERTVGKAQNAFGRLKDAVRNVRNAN